MWSERPNAFKDGLILSTAIGLTLVTILTLRGASNEKTLFVSQCQEVVVDIEKNGNILAQCPVGTYLQIVDGNVICRCDKPRGPTDKEPSSYRDPMPTQPKIPDPFRFHDDKGTVF